MNANCYLNCFKNYILGKKAPLITDQQKKSAILPFGII